MTSEEVRSAFLKFFESRGHAVVQSAPIVVKNDPTLMFTNAGMNQFKDYFLGNKKAPYTRAVDTQKCLRVSGKHNDLEEVGVDTYHHTMFEMLGNWSFGDYFKKDAIAWAWELLTDHYKLPKDRLYVTVFGGDLGDNLPADTESEAFWKEHIDANRIIRSSKKDNFWEMGDTGPCGSCSEIHMDLRSDEERNAQDGKALVNDDHPQVIELWNLVFMEFNRLADGSLVSLPEKHVDTGMGLERVVRATDLLNSNYDTDLFQNTISELEKICGQSYGTSEQTDIAFRVIADHIRAITFCIADGQLPSNTGAGYVVRRILRRAVRYGYSFLNLKEPFLQALVPSLANRFKNVFPEAENQVDFLRNIIRKEEETFLRTLNIGLEKLGQITTNSSGKSIDGKVAFELYDTYGFPLDLTKLIAHENGFSVDEEGFKVELAEQKKRSRADAAKTTGDWIILQEDAHQEFIGYDHLEANITISRYRIIEQKGKKLVQLVFNLTPFYGESGGQVGDTGTLTGTEDQEKVHILDTKKENDLIVHIANALPENPDQYFKAEVNRKRRDEITKNHSATHLMHSALRNVLGDHVAQKGSLVDENRLRFDFSHFEKVTSDQMASIEHLVNEKIRESVDLWEDRSMPYQQAIDMGVTALFGEKYGDVVRVVVFDKNYSMELCGGTHVANTSSIGGFKIISESSVAAGVRRVEAITGEQYEAYLREELSLLQEVREQLGHPKDLVKHITQLISEHKSLSDKIEDFKQLQTDAVYSELKKSVENRNGVNVVINRVEVADANAVKDLCYRLKNDFENLFCVLVADFEGKPNISIMISDNLVQEKQWNAGQLIREWSKHISGGGGGQSFFAQAGGKDASGLDKVLEDAKNLTY
ncbi:MAG: alanine--tRNA ligase [Bacteroidetes bacterium]|nr:alanine--tRNA ligase [Bacteroidota bacterium]